MALTQIDDRGLKTPIDLIDNEKIRLGTGNDLELYHDASNSFTINNTGNYLIKSAGDVYLRTATNEDAVACIANGAVELYYDNVRKFRTTAEGAIVDGSLYLADNKHLILNDTNRAKFGNGEDLQIYHDGSKSVIQNSTGQLNIAGADIRITNAAQTESQIIATENGAVELYHNNVKKFETYSGGCIFQGNIKADQDNATLILGAGSDLQLWHDGTNNIIYSDAPDLYIKTTSSEICARFGRNGGVDLYFDNSKKFETTSSGISVSGTITGAGHFYPSANNSYSLGSASYQFYQLHLGSHAYLDDAAKLICGNDSDLQISHNTNSLIKHEGTGNLYLDSYNKNVYIRAGDGNTSVENSIVCNNNAAVELYYSGTKKFETTSNGVSIPGQLYVSFDASLISGANFKNTNNTGSVIYFSNAAGSVAGSITMPSSTSVSYNTSSDYRLKENEVAISDGITRLKTLKPYRFNFKTDTSTTVDGFFAHEVTPSVPEAITGEKDGTEMQQIDQSKLVPLLTAALQEAITKIETLETEVAALKAK